MDFSEHSKQLTKQLSKEEKKFFENCKKSDNFKPNPTHKDKSFFDRVKEMFN